MASRRLTPWAEQLNNDIGRLCLIESGEELLKRLADRTPASVLVDDDITDYFQGIDGAELRSAVLHACDDGRVDGGDEEDERVLDHDCEYVCGYIDEFWACSQQPCKCAFPIVNASRIPTSPSQNSRLCDAHRRS